MIIEVTTYIAEKILRDDILANLGHDGVEAIIEWNDSIDESIEFDQSLFWIWHRYSSATEAVNDFDSSVVTDIINDLKEGLEEGEEVDDDEVDSECEEWLNRNTYIITLGCGDILVNTEF